MPNASRAYHRIAQSFRGWACVRTALLTIVCGVASPVPPAHAQPFPDPETYFGHSIGADRTLVSYDEYLPYLRLLADRSERVEIHRIGRTTLGRDLSMLVVSTPENLAAADRYRAIAERLHDPRGLSDPEIDEAVAEGKTILLATFNIHASEIVISQLPLLWIYDLATGDAEGPARFLDDVILLVVPSLNPDGQVMVTEWYRKHLGTALEGGDMPWLYHPYAGHDNNRDWFMLNLEETRAVNNVAYHEWYPQVIVDIHQMGMTGPRIFVPPYADPVSERVHPLIYRGVNLLGASMALRLEQQKKSGVIYGYLFDAYWPGGTRSTPWWKNTVGVLIEIASARKASPISIDPGELSGGSKGLVEYQPQVNFPNPWPGGLWRPRDIIEYGKIAVNSALETCALYRPDFLRNRAQMTRDVLLAGVNGLPAGYVIPTHQRDPSAAALLVDLLLDHGIEGFVFDDGHEQEGHVIPAGSVWFPTKQPLAAFLSEMMEAQDYLEVRMHPDSDHFHRPYDVTAWTLPLLMGAQAVTLHHPTRAGLRPLHDTVWGEPGWRTAPVEPGSEERTFALSPGLAHSYTAVFRLLQEGADVRQATGAFAVGQASWPAGTFLVETSGDAAIEAGAGLYVEFTAVDFEAIHPLPVGGAGQPGSPMAFRRLSPPRVGIYQPWIPVSDEGWTRYVFDRNELPYAILHNEEIVRGRLSGRYDAIVLPEMTRAQILGGNHASDQRNQPRYPEPYNGGLGKEGIDELVEFVREGGTLITLGQASEVGVKDFLLPVHALSWGTDNGISTPGTLLRAEIDTQHPLGYGMPRRAALYHTSSPVFETDLPTPGEDRNVVARYPVSGDLILSGWGSGVENLHRKAALVEAGYGEGKVVLFGFRAQHRGQTLGTYRMLFNAILDAAAGRS
jgi:hypothetical protein